MSKKHESFYGGGVIEAVRLDRLKKAYEKLIARAGDGLTQSECKFIEDYEKLFQEKSDEET